MMFLAFFSASLPAVEVPFSAEHDVTTNFTGAAAAVCADVDGDGDADIVGAASNVNRVSWWENLGGQGTNWIEHGLTTNLMGAASVDAADMDNDGHTDIAGAGETGNDVRWWRNIGGAGTSWVEYVAATGFGGVAAIRVADVDGDGDRDIAGAGKVANAVRWCENLGGVGTNWVEHGVASNFSGVGAIETADVDRDGDIDIIGAAATADAIRWWENVGGAGTNWAEHGIATNGGAAVCVADIDGDGAADAVGVGFTAGAVRWWRNSGGQGTNWQERTVTTNLGGARAVFAADIDRDGDTDIGAGGEMAGDIRWWENNGGAGTNWIERAITTNFGGAISARVADVDGDGDADMLGVGNSAGKIAWWENETIHRSAFYAVEHAVETNFAGAYSAYAADMDGDGDMDLLGAAWDADTIAWWRNNDGSGTNWTQYAAATNFNGASSVYAADVDGDGDLDILGTAPYESRIAWWENVGGAGTALVYHLASTNIQFASSVYAVDMDRDGDADILAASPSIRTVAWLENSGGLGTNWIIHVVTTNFDDDGWVTAADLDGDGDLDVPITAYNTGQVGWMENTDGYGTNFLEHLVSTNFGGVMFSCPADVDTDGDNDIVAVAGDKQEVAWWENAGGKGTTFIQHTVKTGFDRGNSVHAADLDADGDIDIAACAATLNEVAWFENVDGRGVTWSERAASANFRLAQSVYAADVDRDGDIDILGAAYDDGIAWWENRGGQFAFATSNTAPSVLLQGGTNDALKLATTHRGRTGDSDEELASIALLMEDGAGDPLSSGEAGALLAAVSLYRDDGSGEFEPALDALVTRTTNFSFAQPGLLTMNSIADGDTNARIARGTSGTFFVVVELTANAAAQTPNRFRITHLTETNTAGAMEDRDHDIALLMEFATNAASGIVVAVLPTADEDGDGMPDWWEQYYFLDPTNGIAGDDGDSDAALNIEEFIADTDPISLASVFAVTNITVETGGVARIAWKGGVQATQWVMRLPNLLSSGEAWMVIFTNSPPTASSGSFTDTAATNGMFFYRIRAGR